MSVQRELVVVSGGLKILKARITAADRRLQ